jgi:hypothetical protein
MAAVAEATETVGTFGTAWVDATGAETEGAARAEATGTAGAAIADTSNTEVVETASVAESEAAGIVDTMGTERGANTVAEGMGVVARGTAGTMKAEGEVGAEAVGTAVATGTEEVGAVAAMGVRAWNSGSLDARALHFFISAARTWRKGSSLSDSESSWGFPALMTCAVRASFTFSTRAEGARLSAL